MAIPELIDAYPTTNGYVGSLTPVIKAYGRAHLSTQPLEYSFILWEGPGYEPEEEEVWAESGWLPAGVNSWQVPAGTLKWGKPYAWSVQMRLGGNTVSSDVHYFLTGIRQPEVTAQLSAAEAGDREFHELAGNYTTAFTDASVSTVGPPLSMVRSYNSLDPRTGGIFGAGWSTRYDMRVLPETFTGGMAALRVTYPEGRQLRFAARGDGTFEPPPGVHTTLAEVAGGGWRLMDKSSTSYAFDSTGALTEMTDSRGREQNLLYGTDGKLQTVTATGGRSLHFTWSGAHVASVSTDAVGGSPLTWTYTYTGDQLAKVCAPGPAPNCTNYTYGTASRYSSTVRNSDPVGYWRLNEPVNPPGWNPPSYCSSTPQLPECIPPATRFAADSGWGKQNATLESMTLGQPGALAGSTNTAATTTGTMHLPKNVLARAGNQASVEMWFKAANPGTLLATGVESTTIDGGEWPAIYIGDDGKLRAQYREKFSGGNVVKTPTTSAQSVDDGQWHHLVLAVSGGQQTLYLDGQTVGTLTGLNFKDWWEIASIGSYPPMNGWPSPPQDEFEATIDEVAVYDRPLTQVEVTAHHAARAQASGKLTKITLPSGRVWSEIAYNTATDRVTTNTDRHGGRWSLGAPAYDATQGISTVTVTDPHNGALKYEYDAMRGHRLIAEIDQRGESTEYGYDTGGHLSEIIDRNGKSVEQAHDRRGNMLSRTTCRTATTCKAEYYAYHYNETDPFDPRNDQMTASRDERSASATDNTYATKWELDTHGDVVKETTPATTDFPAGRSTAYTFTDGGESAVGGGTTPAGLLKSEKDPGGNQTSYRYNAAGDVAEVTDESDLVIRYEYDALGRETSRTEISSANPGGVTTSLTYDDAGRVATHTGTAAENEITQVTHTPQTRYVYNADGLTLTETVADMTGGDPERRIAYAYDAYGRVESVTGPEGGVVRYTWDQTGAQTSMTDELGNVIHNAYTVRGELSSRTLKNWTGNPVDPHAPQDLILESRLYDAEGRLESRVDSIGRKLAYGYFDDDSVAAIVAKDAKLNGSTTPQDVVLEKNTYDFAGNLTEQENGGGKQRTTYVYDAADRLTSTTFDPGGVARRTTYAYDANDNVIREAETGAGTTRTEVSEFEYNSDGARIKETVENGATDLVTTWTVDDRGLVTETVDPRGNLSGADRAAFTTTYRYDASERLVEVREPEVKVEKSGSAAVDARPTITLGYDSAGRRTHSRDAEGRISTTAYDRLGRVTRSSAPPYTPPGGTSITPSAQYAYDAAGRVTRYTDERGSAWTTQYDALGNRVRVVEPGSAGQTGGQWTYEYDTVGELLAAVDPTGARSESTYDDLGRQITATLIERQPTPRAIVSQIEYNTAGYKTKERSPGNRVIGYTVNAAGETEKVTDPLGDETIYRYDLAGRTVKITDPLGNAQEMVYDLAGRETAVRDLNDSGAVQRTIGYEYDAHDNMIAEISGEGSITRYTYDASDSVVELVEPVSGTESITTTYGYDATGALTRVTDGRGNSTWTTYNSLGMVESVIEPATTAHPQAADRTWTSVYDAAGNLTAALQPGGVRVDRQYDHLGRVVRETGAGAQVTTPERTYGYDLAGRETAVGDYTLAYNDRGLLTTVSKGADQVAAFGYDDLGNVTQRTDTAGQATFGWDMDDRLQSAAEPVTGRQLTYAYDAADRLTSLTSADPATTQNFGYDALDRLTSHTLKKTGNAELAKVNYSWDRDDQLVSKVTSGTAGAGTNAYTYDKSGRLTSWSAPGGATTSYEWDAAGNRTKAGAATFSYDERNRLLSGDGTNYTYTPRGTLATETASGTTRSLTFDAFDRLVADGDATYGYDAMGRLTSRIQGGATENYTYSGLDNDIVSVTDSAGAVQARYGRDPSGNLLGLQEGTDPAVGVMTDQHDDVVATFSGTTLVDSAAYDPFGEVTAQSGTRRRLGYQSEYTDPATGKVNMLARWYVPGTGGFASRDDVTLDPYPSINNNRYTYAMGDPLAYTDPSGNCPFCIPLLIHAARIAAQIIARRIAQRLAAEAAKRAAAALARRAAQEAAKKAAQQAAKKAAQEAAKKAAGKAAKQAAKNQAKKFVKSKVKQQAKRQIKAKVKEKIKQKIKSKVKQQAKKKVQQKVKEKAKQKAKQKVKQKAKSRKTKSKSKSQSKSKSKSTKSKSSKSKKSKSFDKNEMILDGFEHMVGEVSGGPTGVEPIDIDLDLGCVSLRGCAKDLIENVVENTTDQVVNELIDQVAPDLPPIDTPGDGNQSCRLRPNSFVAGTPVLMADGTTKPIEDVKPGDLVWATDPEAGYSGPRPVTTAITGDGTKNLVEITVDIDGPRGDATDTITATDEHPFWVPALDEWVNATRLQPGTWLQTSAGTFVQIAAVDRRTTTQRVHNLTVDDLHTYYVVASGQAVLVHNDGPPYTDEECWAIADRVRNETRESMSNTQRRKHVMIIGAVDCVTGSVAVGKKRSEKGGSTHCAEDLVRDELVGRGSRAENIRYGHPAHPDSMNEAEFCARCQSRIDPSQVPPDRRWTKSR
ncbi:LamG-like jellyroll fold domain-containing protein [Spongiactinospora sp. TRM90649]|uniref:LamG-like jellyroll fold domain-containing protein n=1 Tax=Spongiactinospora sp. TRM90649 TaxID=3031114 RepID=UPI0023F6B9A1|nr:LamG-like jellyroll fold domain-containing protein [Spongiactinospora sp. TRM90649]MDF5756464.1 polymorphic toxin-type HINT domain-containing protein [Spongiactinospora sp. TRM90649]